MRPGTAVGGGRLPAAGPILPIGGKGMPPLAVASRLTAAACLRRRHGVAADR